MNSIYRLSSNAFDRKEPNENPRKVVWLSVEGTRTEIKYFRYLDDNKSKLGIDSAIIIEPLKKNDTKSDPLSVLNLLDEYVMLKDKSLIQQIKGLSDLEDAVELENIRLYLENENLVCEEVKCKIKNAINLAKYDVEYHKYLDRIGIDDDIFAIVIDTEGKDNESRNNIEEIIDNCKTKGYRCFLSNPCFEFFLLLHTYNPIEEYNENKDNFINNHKVSKAHTYVSKLLSDCNKHSKKITKKTFDEIYLPNIKCALKNSEDWAHELDTVKDNVGTNMVSLFKLVGF
ncbi:MAG: RloB domain-containing protein [Spirochaetaceae bacterium]|nr:RloB domain-containing protein [Spirochaetaceae bacterium]